jgi:hypothetical protein
MNKKQIIIAFSAVLVASYVGFFLYQRNNRKKADEAVNSYEEAMKKLKEAKDGFNPLYSEPTEFDVPEEFKVEPKNVEEEAVTSPEEVSMEEQLREWERYNLF